MKVLALVDGEHYPSVTRWGLDSARSMGHEILAALFVGGTEKVPASGRVELGVPTLRASGEPSAELAAAIERLRPEAVLDLSDEPVLGYEQRMELAAVSLVRGTPYLGPDFVLKPPITGPALPVPTVAVIGTGKRTGKTALSGELARVATAAGVRAVIVAMGRGGPPAPQVVEAGAVDLEGLLDLVRRGQHAASDYLEDALMSGVAAVGARRCGGGLAGAPFVSNVREAAEVAVGMGAELVVLEGSGSCVPPIPWDAGVLVVPASAPPEHLGGYLGPFRLLLSDLVVATMATGPGAGPENLSALRSHVRRLRGSIRFVATDFEPVPLSELRGKRVFFTTTAPEPVARRQAARLEANHGCRVTGWSAHLSNRGELISDLHRASEYDVLVTELKAAAVDVACEEALARGARVVFMDNRPVAISEDDDLRSALSEVLELGMRRGEGR